MDITVGELVLGFLGFLLLGPPRWIYEKASRQYRKTARRLQTRLSHTMAHKVKREAREAENRAHPFMKLPGELRNRIYALSMISDAVLDPVWGRIYDLKRVGETEYFLEDSSQYPHYRSQLYSEYRFETNAVTAAKMANMSQVCKVWREEAVKFYYGSNVFKFPIGEHLYERKGRRSGRLRVRSTARREYYTGWLRKFPKEAFSVSRLVLHDYRDCPHPVETAGTQSSSRRCPKTGSCLIFLDFEQQAIAPVRATSNRDNANLWDCETCWKEFADVVLGLNENEEVVELFAEFTRGRNTDSAIKVIDQVRVIIEGEYQRKNS